MSSNSSKFQKVTFEVRSIPLAHCGIEEIACWCDLLAIEEVSWRLELTLATCGYIILQSCTIIMEAHEPLDPAGVCSLCPGGVVLGLTRLTDLSYEIHGSRMACEDSNVDIWEYERWQRRRECE